MPRDVPYITTSNVKVERGDVNREGQHAVAISLVRQCVEALTILECALISDRVLCQSLLTAWINGKKTFGAIRKELSCKVWASIFQAFG